MEQLIADIAKNWPIIFSACLVTGTGVWIIFTVRHLNKVVDDIKEDLEAHTAQDFESFTKLTEQITETREESTKQHQALRELVASEFRVLDEKGSARIEKVHNRLDKLQEKS